LKAKILIVEDQFIEANNLQMILERAGYQVCSIARSVATALEILEQEHPDLVFLDIYLDGELTGIDLARILKERDIAFLYLSANSSKQTLAAAKTTKPYGFLVKPFREKDVLVMLDVAWYLHSENMESIRQRSAAAGVRNQRPSNTIFEQIVGRNSRMLEVLDLMKMVSYTDTSVLILGESGTGKELVAKGIHQLSSRSKQPLVVVNCAALPSNLIESELFGHEKGAFTGALERRVGKFEQADGGTIFLDEIGELPLELQVKFLRVLQEKEVERVGGMTKQVDVRLIAATNKDLEEEVAAGRFRMDLYYRLNVFPVILPPLRERPDDILVLANHFVRQFAGRHGKVIQGFSDNVAREILDYGWPGNVRELENMMERSVLLTRAEVIDFIELDGEVIAPSGGMRQRKRIKTMWENERDHILAALEMSKWKIYGEGGAAQILDMHVSTLNSRIKKLGIKKGDR
jgi:two-component system, NtrC family, response regulator HydG